MAEEVKHTPGPWPWKYTGDGKRILIGDGLVEGPNGYEVAEVYSDDCPSAVAEANARLIAAAPDLLKALHTIRNLWAGHAEQCAYVVSRYTKKCDCDWPGIAAQCDAAIAKATIPNNEKASAE